jgi:hypothetical protein
MSDVNEFEVDDECLSCYDDFTDETSVQYRDIPDGKWKKSPYCMMCMTYLQDNNWSKYMTDVKKADCKASLRRAMKDGPPINIRDSAIKCDNTSNEVYQLLYKNTIKSAKLKDSFEGDARTEWWDEWKNILETMENIKDIKDTEDADDDNT